MTALGEGSKRRDMEAEPLHRTEAAVCSPGTGGIVLVITVNLQASYMHTAICPAEARLVHTYIRPTMFSA